MKIPKLRFKPKNGGIFPAWSEKTLAELTDIFKSGQGITSSRIRAEGEYPVYGGNGLRGYAEEFTHDGYYALIGRQGALCGNINTVDGKTFISEHAIAVKATQDSSTEWLAIKLELMNLNRLSESSAQPGLAVKKLLKLKVNAPCIEEQEKIAAFIGAIDQKISLLSKKHELLVQYKRGVMQKIFNQEIRFKDGVGKDFQDWKFIPLKEMGDTFNGLTGKSSEDFGRGAQYITYKQIFDSSKIDASKFGLVNIDISEEQNEAKFGDLFFTTSSETPSEVGYCSALLDNVKNLYLNSFCFGYRLKSFQVLSPHYARFMFFSSKVRDDIVLLAQGSTRYNISKTGFMKIKVPVAHIDEQEKIASFLVMLESKIDAIHSKLGLIKQFKQGLLRQMFV